MRRVRDKKTNNGHFAQDGFANECVRIILGILLGIFSFNGIMRDEEETIPIHICKK